MIHEIKRCKHCYRQYSYQASGDGCFNPVNDKDYCPECMSVINEALSKITKKFEPRFRMVEMGDDFYKNNLLPLKEKYEEYRKKKGYLFEATKLVSCNKKYKDSIIEGYYFNNAEFIVEKYGDEIIINVLSEYDLTNENFTNNTWHVKSDNNFYYATPITHMLEQMNDIFVNELEKPKGEIFYSDFFKWKVKNDKDTNNK